MNSADELDRPINLPESKVLAMSMYLEHSSGSNDDLPVTFKGYPSECQSSVMSIIEVTLTQFPYHSEVSKSGSLFF